MLPPTTDQPYIERILARLRWHFADRTPIVHVRDGERQELAPLSVDDLRRLMCYVLAEGYGG